VDRVRQPRSLKVSVAGTRLSPAARPRGRHLRRAGSTFRGRNCRTRGRAFDCERL